MNDKDQPSSCSWASLKGSILTNSSLCWSTSQGQDMLAMHSGLPPCTRWDLTKFEIVQRWIFYRLVALCNLPAWMKEISLGHVFFIGNGMYFSSIEWTKMRLAILMAVQSAVAALQLFAPVCSSWTRISRGTSWRTFINVFGDLSSSWVRDANTMLSRPGRTAIYTFIIFYIFQRSECGFPNNYTGHTLFFAGW